MFWVALFVPLGVVSVVVLGLLAVRLWREVRGLGRAVSAAGDRLAAAGASRPAVRSSGSPSR